MGGRRVLVRLPNWIGDAVMALPAVLALGRARPDVEWALLGGARARPLFEGLDEPFRLLPALPSSISGAAFLAIARRLRRERFDAALLFPPSFRAALEARAAGVPILAGWATDARGPLLTVRGPEPTRSRPLREQYYELAARLLERLEGESLPPIPAGGLPPGRAPLRAEELAGAEALLEERRLDATRTIALAPGATFGPTKRWPPERFAELARRLAARGYVPLWIGGADEAALASTLAAEAGGVSFAGALSIRGTLAVLSRVRAAVSNDSGAMHLAQAAGCAVVGIFGSTSPEWTGPAGDRGVSVREPVPCAPCFSPRCPTQVECLTGISVDRVEAALLELAARTASGGGRPAVFLDRDGTIIEEVNYLRDPEAVRLLPGAAEGMRALQAGGFALVVVTNQSAVARGLLSRAGLHAVHLRLREELRAAGVRLEGIEFCPHHPDFTGACSCRKPADGMLRRAAHRFDLDLARSYLVGDSRSDLEAGRRAGCRTVLVRTGYGGKLEADWRAEQDRRAPARAPDQLSDAVVDDLAVAASWILAAGRAVSSNPDPSGAGR